MKRQKNGQSENKIVLVGMKFNQVKIGVLCVQYYEKSISQYLEGMLLGQLGHLENFAAWGRKWFNFNGNLCWR